MKLRHILIGAAMASALSISAFAASNNSAQKTNSFTPEQVQQLHTIIRNYLVKNPEVLVEASQKLQMEQMQKAQQQSVAAISQNKQQLFKDAASPSIGNPNGKAIIVEFFDYQCGHCKTMGSIVQKVVKNDKNVKVIFKELPIFGANSQFAAKAALAAVKQGKYFEFHDALLAAGNPLTKVKVIAIAKKVGLNIKQLQKDMKSQAVGQQIRDNFKLAQKLKLMGTPAFIVANEGLTQFRFIPGATTQENMQKQINAVNS